MMNERSAQLIAPATRALLLGTSAPRMISPLGSSGELEYGASFHYPDPLVYANSMSQALAAITPDVKQQLAVQFPPLVDSIATLRGVFQTLTGLAPGGRVSSQTAPDVFAAFSDLCAGVADIVGAFGQVGELAEVASGIAESVPILSTAWKTVMLGVGIWEAAQAQKFYEQQMAKQLAQEDRARKCAAAINAGVVEDTLSDGPSPADLFRKVAQWGPGRELPCNLGSVYVVMCAPETEGFGPTRGEYEDFVSREKLRHRIPKHVKRQMWSLIKGIMGSIVDPTHRAYYEGRPGDDGLALMPLLQEILRGQEVVEVANFNNETVHAFYEQWVVPKRGGYGRYGDSQSVIDPRSCRVHMTKNYASSFIKGIDKWYDKLGELTRGYAQEVAESQQRQVKKGILALGKNVMYSMTEEAVAARQQAEERRLAYRKYMDPAMAVAGTAAASYLVWTGVRKFGPKRRK